MSLARQVGTEVPKKKYVGWAKVVGKIISVWYILTKKGIWTGYWVFHLFKLNFESFFNLYDPINQFYSSVLMDYVKQSRKM